MIFELCLRGVWDGQRPALIVALRSQSELYSEALEIFRKHNSSNLSQHDLKLLKAMPLGIMSGIRKIALR